MKLVWTVLFACSLLSAASAQDTSKPVDYVARALPLRQVLFDLEKKSGVRLDCDPAMENEPLILKLNGVPLQEALDKIALVFAADWVKHDTTLRLERSPAKLQTLRQEILAKQVSAVKESIESLRALRAENPPLDAESAAKLIKDYVQTSSQDQRTRSTATRVQLFKMGSRMPTMRLAIQILARMNPEELVRLSHQGRFVYASNPNASQHEIPDLDPQIFEEWRASRRAVAEAYDRVKPNVNVDDYNVYSTLSDKGADDPVPSRILIVSQNMGNPLPIYLSFTFYDSNGRVLAQDGENLEADYKKVFDYRQALDESKRRSLQTGFELGPVGKELAPRAGGNRANLRPLPQFVVDALSHPTRQDPLSFATSDIILTSAEQEGVNAIALLDDTAEYFALSTARTGKTSLESFQIPLTRADLNKVDLDDRWLVARVTDPVAAQERRAPRDVMEEFLQANLNQGFLTIEQVANAAFKSSRAAMAFMQGAAETLVTSHGNNPTYSDWSALWLYASLSPAQQEKAASPEGLTLTGPAVSPEQASMAQEFALQGDNFLEGVPPPKMQFGPGDIYPEPERTDYFGDGITPDCTLKFKVESSDALFQSQTYDDGNAVFWFPADPAYLSSTLGVALHPELFPRQPGTDRPTQFQQGVKRTLTVKLSKGDLSMSATASEQHMGDASPISAQQYLDSLPLARRLELEKQIEDFLKRFHREEPPESPKPPRS